MRMTTNMDTLTVESHALILASLGANPPNVDYHLTQNNKLPTWKV